ncbi:MAG: 50S ribosomal protein L23 [Bacteroidota bacterium]
MADIIKRPVITEKAMKLGEHDPKQYVFEVNPTANKIEIRKAIQDLFEVKVQTIRTVKTKGKVKRRMTRRGVQEGKLRTKKKAYVTLLKGQSIDIVSGSPESSE